MQPAALQADWSLRHTPSLISPRHGYKGYLGGHFASALTTGRDWTHTWSSQIVSALAWVQVALLFGYTRADTMRAMHEGIHWAYGDSPHNVQGTIKAVYCLLYSMPAKKCALRELHKWVSARAHWKGGDYTSWVQREEEIVQVYKPAWNTNFAALEVMRAACCRQAGCVCASSRERVTC